MSREVHVRFCERPEVKFLRPTHPYVTIATGFVYLAAILDAWSRRVVGYAISRSIDARLAVAALKAAISARNPPRGCVHHSDRGSQYASEDYRAVLQKHGLTGSMGRRGNPYDKAKAESFMKRSRGSGSCSPGRTGLSRSSGPGTLSSRCTRSRGSSSWRRRSPRR